jgi:hypothetical protein
MLAMAPCEIARRLRWAFELGFEFGDAGVLPRASDPRQQ